ncbi:MAG: EscU/YscU/HrcU family type III secretion system export apparatus switch protein [Candidatus Hydrogenedentota bacterium]
MDESKKNPAARRKAVALRYDAERDRAPKIVAKGSGYLADRIIELAEEHGVHIQDDPDLVAVLSKLNADAEIPPDLYRAVAEVLAFVYRINGEQPQPR